MLMGRKLISYALKPLREEAKKFNIEFCLISKATFKVAINLPCDVT